MGWPFGKKPREGWREKPRAIESEIPRDHERVGPAPPPPRTTHAPGVVVCAFDALPSRRLLRLAEGTDGFFLESEEGNVRTSALLVLSSGGGAPGPGDVFVWKTSSPGAISPSSSFEEAPGAFPLPGHHIRRDDVAGRGVPGITGLRLRHAGDGLTVLRLGPPPGARWVFVGLRAIAVFAGKLSLVDGEEPVVVPAGRLALVADPTATLYVEAGNDSAVAVALGRGSVVSALG